MAKSQDLVLWCDLERAARSPWASVTHCKMGICVSVTNDCCVD